MLLTWTSISPSTISSFAKATIGWKIASRPPPHGIMPLLQSHHYAIICYCACADLLRGIADHASFCQQCDYKLWSLTWQWVASCTLVPWRIYAVNPSDITFWGFHYHEATRFIEGGPAVSQLELLLGSEVFITHFLECTKVRKWSHGHELNYTSRRACGAWACQIRERSLPSSLFILQVSYSGKFSLVQIFMYLAKKPTE